MDDIGGLFDGGAVALLANMRAWRLRAVERVELSSAFWSERHREIHVRSFEEIMGEQTNGAVELRGYLSSPQGRQKKDIELLLPITELPKVPVFDLHITVDGHHVYRLSKDESARIVAKYVIRLARDAGRMLPEDEPKHLLDFLTFLFYHPDYPYEQILRSGNNPNTEDANFNTEDATFRYLSDAKIPVKYYTWTACVREIKKAARHYVVHDYASGAENPLIALPYFLQEMENRHGQEVPNILDITRLMRYVSEAVSGAYEAVSNALAERSEAPAAEDKFLSAYFAYGHRWMTFAKCTVPVNRPFIVTVEEKRAIYFEPERRLNRKPSLRSQRRKDAWQMVSFADAETNHVSIRVNDTAVRMGRPEVLTEDNKPFIGNVDEEESTFEVFLLQDSTRGRPERVYIKCPLRLTRLHSGMLWLTMFLTALGIFLLLNRGLSPVDMAPPHNPAKESTSLIDDGLTAKNATLILVPVAFAASFLLIRDSSTLSAWLRRIRQFILLIELFTLLAIAFTLLWIHHFRIE
ncbi:MULTISPECIES: hypothetical protein [unclassified Streptomyces]|uniref:hypothetical protein n=1 Tax=unclassified Streptomyces TaxID=2593676 RepID=UPI0016561B1D|nr:hypothetical protein [Streptomyces sp. CB02980]MCB8902015.1 hypothetical protein [Streptomyces sp. CB02980]